MRVIILGFDNVKEIDNVMEKLIAESACFIFSVVVTDIEGTAAQWAKMKGAPIYITKANDLDRLAKEIDYMVMKLNERSPQWFKLFMGKVRALGKHGTIVR